MDISELQINSAIIEDRIRAALKAEYPVHYDVKIDLLRTDIRKEIIGPVWEDGDAIGFPVHKMIFTINCEVQHRTDFKYREIQKRGTK